MALLSRDRTICGRLFAAQRVRKTRLKGSTEQVQHIVIRPADAGSLKRLARVRGGRANLLLRGTKGSNTSSSGEERCRNGVARFRVNRSRTITAFSFQIHLPPAVSQQRTVAAAGQRAPFGTVSIKREMYSVPNDALTDILEADPITPC